MSTEIEDRVALSLRDRADRDVDTDTLLAGAVRRGHRRLVRQRLSWLGVIVVLIAGMVAFGVLRPYPPGGGHPAAPEWTDLTQRSLDSQLVAPAAPVGTPTALDDPAVVGSDPGLVHLSVAPLPGHYVESFWEAGTDGGESLGLTDADEYARVAAGASDTDGGTSISLIRTGHGFVRTVPGGAAETGTFTLGGATVTDYLVRLEAGQGRPGPNYRVLVWQPAAGLLIQLHATTDDRKARLIAAAVRLDAVHRCVVPYQLNQPPAGTADSCELTLTTPQNRGIGTAQGLATTYTLTHGAGTLRVKVSRHTGTLCGKTTEYPTTVPFATGTGQWSGVQGVPGEGQLTLCQPVGGLAVGIEITGTGYTETDAVRAAKAVRPAGRLDRPDSWPASPLP